MKESRDKSLSVRVRDRDEGRKSKENGVSSSSKSKDEGPSPGSKRRRSESPMSPTDSRGKRETDNTSEELKLREALLRDKIKRSRKNDVNQSSSET